MQKQRKKDAEDDRNTAGTHPDGAAMSPATSGLLRYFPPTTAVKNDAKKDSHDQVDSTELKDATDTSEELNVIEDTASDTGMSAEQQRADEVGTDSQETIDASPQEGDGECGRESQETSICSSNDGSDDVVEVSLASADIGRPSRPQRQVAQRTVSYLENVLDDESDSEEQKMSVSSGNAQQNNFTITRYFNPKPIIFSQSNGNSENETIQQAARAEDQSQSESELEQCVVPMIEAMSSEMGDGSGMETDTIEASQSSNCETECAPQSNGGETTAPRLQPQIQGSQMVDDAVVPSVGDQSAENDYREGCDQPDHLPITTFFPRIVKLSQQPPGAQTDEETAEDEEETEEEEVQEKNEGKESEEGEKVNGEHEDEDDDTCDEEEERHKRDRETYNISGSGVPKSMRVTRFFTPVVKRIRLSQRKETDDEESDDGSNSDQSESLPVAKFITPVLKPFKNPNRDTNEQETDEGANSSVMEDASDEENWDAITEVCMSSSKHRKRCNSRFSGNREINTSALLSRIRKAQRSATRKARFSSTELSWSLEVDVIVRNSTSDLFNDVTSSEDSSDEDYTRIMQEEESVLHLNAPILGCEPNPNGDRLIDETDGQQSEPEIQSLQQTRKRRRPLSIPDSDEDDLNCEVSQSNVSSVRQGRGRVSDSDFSGGTDSGLGGSTDNHSRNRKRKEKPIREGLVSEEKDDGKKCNTSQQQRRKKLKRRRLISKQERQEAMESRCPTETAIDNSSVIAGKMNTSSSADQMTRRSTRLAALQNQSGVTPEGSSEAGVDNCDTKNVGIAPVFRRQERKETKSGKAEPDKMLGMKGREVGNSSMGSSREPPTPLFPLFCKPSKQSEVTVEVNNTVYPLVDSVTECSELGSAPLLPQRKIKKNTDDQPPAVSYMPFPEVSHVLQYSPNGSSLDKKPEVKGFVVNDDTLTISGTDGFIQSHGESLKLGTLTSCQCKHETSTVAGIRSIGEEEKQQLLKDLSHVTSSVDVHSLYEKYLQEVKANSDTNSTLWTDMFAPCNSPELAVNRSAVCKLRKWLADWDNCPEISKRRIDSLVKSTVALDEKRDLDWLDDDDFVVIRKRKQRRIESDSESGEEEEMGCNAVLLLGGHGSGKTAAVYASAKELDMTVSRHSKQYILFGKVMSCLLDWLRVTKYFSFEIVP